MAQSTGSLWFTMANSASRCDGHTQVVFPTWTLKGLWNPFVCSSGVIIHAIVIPYHHI